MSASLVIVFQLIFTIMIQFLLTIHWQLMVACTAEGVYIYKNFRKTLRIRIHHKTFWPGELEDRRDVLGEKHNEVTKLESAREELSLQLEQLREKGVKLFVDGEAALPGEAAAKAVQEGSPYMADYVLGDTGNIEQVRFDKVTRC